MRRLLYILIASLFTFAGAKAQGIDVDSVLADSVGAEMELAEPYAEMVYPISVDCIGQQIDILSPILYDFQYS